jgi:glycosyltransferase involved in cell wall biosynthesis
MISVLMSCYNNATSLEEAIESILNQSYSDFEFLIINDGSTDNSQDILNKYYSNKKIKLFKNKKNIGLTKSLNILIEKAQGDYIARQDADDKSLESRLEEQIKFLDRKKIQICTTRAFTGTTKKLIPGVSFYLPNKILMQYKNPFIHGTLLIKTEILKEYKYDQDYYFAQDYELLNRLLKKYKVKTLNKALYILNMENNISTNFKLEQLSYFKKVKLDNKNK